ncbi:MAG: iron-siderophore ABC transporter substrate-binding protein, partial [Staphylococcus equorum]|nr:iron-siderophore ABC transporter substrate-binding protein [Staphylococcus equorum]
MGEVINLKKILCLILCFIMFLAACGSGNESNKSDAKDDKGTKSYTTEDGSKVKIPKDPKRVLVLTANYGNLKKLGVKPVG